MLKLSPDRILMIGQGVHTDAGDGAVVPGEIVGWAESGNPIVKLNRSSSVASRVGIKTEVECVPYDGDLSQDSGLPTEAVNFNEVRCWRLSVDDLEDLEIDGEISAWFPNLDEMPAESVSVGAEVSEVVIDDPQNPDLQISEPDDFEVVPDPDEIEDLEEEELTDEELMDLAKEQHNDQSAGEDGGKSDTSGAESAVGGDGGDSSGEGGSDSGSSGGTDADTGSQQVENELDVAASDSGSEANVQSEGTGSDQSLDDGQTDADDDVDDQGSSDSSGSDTESGSGDAGSGAESKDDEPKPDSSQ